MSDGTGFLPSTVVLEMGFLFLKTAFFERFGDG